MKTHRNLYLILVCLGFLNYVLWFGKTETIETHSKINAIPIAEASFFGSLPEVVITAKKIERTKINAKPEKVSWNVHIGKTTTIKRRKSIAITDIIKDATVLNFIDKNQFLQRAHGVQKNTGLMVSTIISQKGLESNWGKSSLTKKTKNLSNIKCTRKACKKANIKLRKHGQTGSTTEHCIQLYDDKPSDRFVRLDYNYQGWAQYQNLLLRRYSRAGKGTTVKQQARELKRRGWATQKNYAELIASTAKKYNLEKLQWYIDNGYSITTTNGKFVLLDQ